VSELAQTLLARGYVLIDEIHSESKTESVVLHQKFSKGDVRVRISWERHVWEVGAIPVDTSENGWNEGGGWPVIWQHYLTGSFGALAELSKEEECAWLVDHLGKIEWAIENDPGVRSKLSVILDQFNQGRGIP
jgi:hypothetical protein